MYPRWLFGFCLVVAMVSWVVARVFLDGCSGITGGCQVAVVCQVVARVLLGVSEWLLWYPRWLLRCC